jgi:SAM-dependent methyltransferase
MIKGIYLMREFTGLRSAEGHYIASMIEAQRASTLNMCRCIAMCEQWFLKIPLVTEDGIGPSWTNGELPALDGMVLYSLIASRRPKLYLEFGTGASTKFVRRAIEDHKLNTRVVSFDLDAPTSSVALRDELFARNSAANPGPIEWLSSGDVVLFNYRGSPPADWNLSSFLQIAVPRLPAGVIFGVHGIFLPLACPAGCASEFGELQRPLVNYLASPRQHSKIAFPGLFASLDPEARGALDFYFRGEHFRDAERHAATFWLETSHKDSSEVGVGPIAEGFDFSTDIRTDNGMFQSEIYFLSKLPTGGRILDVGCGNDSPFNIKRLRPDCRYTGIDVGDYNQSNAVADVEYILTSGSKFADEIYSLAGSFDAVISTHNIEHCDHREKTFDAMLKALKPGGQLYMLFPSELSASLPSRRGCLNYFDDGTHAAEPPNFQNLIDHLKRMGFEIVIARREYMPSADFLRGMVNDKESVREGWIKPGTWSYYGFESIIWAKRGVPH